MISGHDARCVWVLGALLALQAIRPTPAAAESYLVVLIEPEETELVTRVKGQTRDLGVELEVLEDDSAERTASAEARLAAASGADFLARIERTAAGTLEVRVYDAKQRTLRARSVPAPPRRDRLASSAELEAAALVLRGEVSALIEAREEAARRSSAAPPAAVSGGTEGPTRPPAPAPVRVPVPVRVPPEDAGDRDEDEVEDNDEDEDEEEVEDNDEDEDEEEIEDEEEVEDEEEEPEAPSVPLENYSARSRTLTLRAGLRTSRPVDSTMFGLFAGGRAQFGWVEVGLSLHTSLPVELADENVRIRLRRHGFAAEALGVVPWGPRLRVLFGVEAGAVLYSRATQVLTAGYEAADSTLRPSLALGAQAELQWLLERQWGLALSVGFSYLPQPTRFQYTAGQSQDGGEVGAIHSVEPLLCVSLFGLFGP